MRGGYEDGKGEERGIVLLRKADGGADGVLGGFEGTMKRSERNLEIDHIVASSGLNGVVILEDAFLLIMC